MIRVVMNDFLQPSHNLVSPRICAVPGRLMRMPRQMCDVIIIQKVLAFGNKAVRI